MNCGYEEKTVLYFYGELPGAASAELQEHLKTCPSCRSDLSLLAGLSAELDAFRPRPPELDADSLAAVARIAPSWFSFPVFMRRAAAAAAAALFLAAFHFPDMRKDPFVWRSGIDEGLESVSDRLYTLETEAVYPVSADFDYAYSYLEERREEAEGRL